MRIVPFAAGTIIASRGRARVDIIRESRAKREYGPMFQSDLLKGKRILITGGGSGLGKSMGRRFLELGARLVICGRRANVLEATAAENNADFAGATEWHVCDIRDPNAVEAMIEKAWTNAPIDGLVNNAAGNFLAKSETLSHRALDAVLGIVLHG